MRWSPRHTQCGIAQGPPTMPPASQFAHAPESIGRTLVIGERQTHPAERGRYRRSHPVVGSVAKEGSLEMTRTHWRPPSPSTPSWPASAVRVQRPVWRLQ